MKIEKIYPRGFAANTYLLTADGEHAVVVDPAQPRVEAELRARNLKPAYVLLTHAHFDHVGGVPALQAQGAKVFCSEAEKPLVGTGAQLFEEFGVPAARFVVDGTFRDGERRELCGMTVQAIFTPGHTAGGMCYLIEADGERALFTGDTLFAGSAGRTDFPTGDAAGLRESLKRLAALEGDLPVYAGHDEDTSLDEERRNNLFLRD